MHTDAQEAKALASAKGVQAWTLLGGVLLSVRVGDPVGEPPWAAAARGHLEGHLWFVLAGDP